MPIQNNSETTPLTSDSQSQGANYTTGDSANNNSNTGNSNSNFSNADDAEDESCYDEEENITKHRFFGRGQWNVGRVVFYLFFYFIVQPVTLAIALLLWLCVFSIPMAKTLAIINEHVRSHPLALSFEVEKDYYQKRLNSNPGNESILICTYRSFGIHYYKFTVDGILGVKAFHH
ncbi:unnamed protein product [Ambrosiozyma monospora]|uniref:Unnamed protein product n=1 Tax=Ambrosiozyma monospora TaxID=43982 RepID=A0A9W6Z5B8_AMBMO|nr:unnamed protein product [Ambrosiozyma monospora]